MTRGATQAVLLTPRGRGAVATIGVEGPGALPAVDSVFFAASGRPLTDLPPGRIAFGRFGDPRRGEEVVVCRHDDERIEIHCHGGLAAPEAILARLEQLGCARASWRDWLDRRRMGTIQTEALKALLEAPTRRTATILLDQYDGALRRQIALFHAQLDAGKIDAARRQIEQLLAYRHLAERLDQPWRVALVGPVNVGKSSLLNAMLGFERAIVLDRPGTTRDVLTALTALDGWPIELADTAGLREIAVEPSADEETAGHAAIEAAGIHRARLHAAGADLVLLVFDRAAGWSAAQETLRRSFPDALGLLNKCDLPAPADANFPNDLQPVSALTGRGLDRLVERILRRLVEPIPPAGAAVPFRERHVRLLEAAAEALRRGDTKEARRCIADLDDSSAGGTNTGDA